MDLIIISFTEKGYELGGRIKGALTGYDADLIFKGRGSGASFTASCGVSLADICGNAFAKAVPLVFIGAAGIAVRSVAPFVRDKLSDPPVIVIDELGRFVVPVLSGHVGGANELALTIASAIDAVPVITTATDINDVFAVDLFAGENGLSIANRDGIARVSASALDGRPVTISIRNFPPDEHVDVLITDGPVTESPLRDAASIVLCPRKYALGMGCRRGKSFEELRDFAAGLLRENGIEQRDIGCIATIDIKQDEEGLRELSRAWRVPLITFDAELLSKAKGDFGHSELVLEKTGVDNVCERAAVLAAGAGSRMVMRKHAENGMTAAVAERQPQAAGERSSKTDTGTLNEGK